MVEREQKFLPPHFIASLSLGGVEQEAITSLKMKRETIERKHAKLQVVVFGLAPQEGDSGCRKQKLFHIPHQGVTTKARPTMMGEQGGHKHSTNSSWHGYSQEGARSGNADHRRSSGWLGTWQVITRPSGSALGSAKMVDQVSLFLTFMAVLDQASNSCLSVCQQRPKSGQRLSGASSFRSKRKTFPNPVSLTV